MTTPIYNAPPTLSLSEYVENIYNKKLTISVKKFIIDNYYDEILSKTNFIDSNATLKNRLYCLKNNITQIPKCPICGNFCKFIESIKQYSKTCNNKCALILGSENRIKTKLEKYGDSTYNNREKSNKTTKENNKQDKYRLAKIAWTDEIILKRKLSRANTDIKKFNDKNEKYEIISHVKDYIINNFVKYKCKQCNNIFTKKKNNLGKAPKIRDIRCNVCYPVKSISNCEYELREFIESLNLNTKIVYNSKSIISPKELDIYLPEYKLAIEMNGDMFHSAGKSKMTKFNKSKDEMQFKHMFKSFACRDKNIKLIHIRDSQWDESKDCCKSLILSHLNLNKIINIEDCEVKLIEDSILDFYKENNMYSSCEIYDPRDFILGLYYESDLICLIFIKLTNNFKVITNIITKNFITIQNLYDFIVKCDKNILININNESEFIDKDFKYKKMYTEPKPFSLCKKENGKYNHRIYYNEGSVILSYNGEII